MLLGRRVLTKEADLRTSNRQDANGCRLLLYMCCMLKATVTVVTDEWNTCGQEVRNPQG